MSFGIIRYRFKDLDLLRTLVDYLGPDTECAPPGWIGAKFSCDEEQLAIILDSKLFSVVEYREIKENNP